MNLWWCMEKLSSKYVMTHFLQSLQICFQIRTLAWKKCKGHIIGSIKVTWELYLSTFSDVRDTNYQLYHLHQITLQQIVSNMDMSGSLTHHTPIYSFCGRISVRQSRGNIVFCEIAMGNEMYELGGNRLLWFHCCSNHFNGGVIVFGLTSLQCQLRVISG